MVLTYQKKDLQNPRNYCPIYVAIKIYSIMTPLLLRLITQAMILGLLNIQDGALFALQGDFCHFLAGLRGYLGNCCRWLLLLAPTGPSKFLA